MTSKREKKHRPYIDYIEMANWPVDVGYTCSVKAFDKEMERLRVAYPDGAVSEGKVAATHHFRVDGKATAIVVIKCPDEYTWIETVGVIVHEAMHVVRYIFETIGEDEPGWETEAYLLQYLTIRFLVRTKSLSRQK